MSKIFNKLIMVLALLPALLFILLGMRWLVDPSGVAPEFGYELATGLGRSSQIGDMAGYFLMAGFCILLGLTFKKSVWLYPPVLLLSITAAARLTSWVVHDATLAVQMILVEVFTSVVLLVAANRVAQEEQA